jgi:hypothetical protein
MRVTYDTGAWSGVCWWGSKMLQFASQAEQFRAKADMCFAWSKRLPDPEYQRI